MGAYLPGYRAGGPIQSIANLVEALSESFEFKIITQNHDLGVFEPYPNVVADVWTQVGKAQVMYLSYHGQALHKLWQVIRNTSYDVIYLNSFFSRRFSMFPYALWRLKLIRDTPLILAPRGEFSKGALNLKRFRKKIFLSISKLINWYNSRKMTWHASAQHENNDIVQIFNNNKIGIAAPIVNGENLKKLTTSEMPIHIAFDITGGKPISLIHPAKEPGSLSLAFVSRICPMKNLDFALRALSNISGNIDFDICGPIEDMKYWQDCKNLIANLPKFIKVRYLGEIPHDEVNYFFKDHHVFLFPTRGENFGHVISEALCAGCPIIISDQTLWRDLQNHGVGWDLPLDNLVAFHDAIQSCVGLDNEEYEKLSFRAREYGNSHSLRTEAVQMNQQLFKNALKIDGAG